MTEVIMPKIGMLMAEGTIEEWLVEDGGAVEKGEILFSISSEKVANDIEAMASGILKIIVQAGETVEVGEVIGEIVEK